MEYHLPAPSLTQQRLKHVSRSQNRPAYSRPTRHTTLHLKLRVRAELERKAKGENLSVSATGSAILEWFFEQSISMQHAATLETAIDKSIGRYMRGYSDRNAALQVRTLIKTELILGIATNILGRQPGMDENILREIMNDADEAARASITRTTQQQKNIVATEKKQFDEKGGKTSD